MSANIEVAPMALPPEGRLPPTLQEQLLARARRFTVRRGHLVIAAGNPSTDVFLIERGKVQISVLSLHGKETILREMGPGEFFGELAAIDQRPRSSSVVALEECALACVSGEAFRDLLSRDPAASYWITRHLVAMVRDLTEKTFELATMSVSNRLQSELLRLSGEVGGNGDQCLIAHLPTHADLAARIGTHREAVTRELRLLASEKIVQQTGRTLAILSLKRLRALRDKTSR